ncbi:LysR family transcriptional regulator [Sphingomonas radiodurans]|uniref:LysR family transcriptional regulator n=1 Tax=Sphingomonas radiodurans TaxID=2890321 RepID=UPI001E548435|nr:LysR family transcriptional regulator [Sphingomonas radiodurans]WBH18168.1 LysR family transcriptional regulator [Sphingomonas radiodurans]
MNLRHIEVFHAVYSVGSISGASRLLNVSQPSVSKIVKHAETRLGFPLFTLVRGRLTPTDEAHILFREVDDLHSRIDTFQRAARNMRSTSEGHIRVGVLPSLALAATPMAIARFRRQLPLVTFEVSAIHHDQFREALMSRECDFVIGHAAPPDLEIASVPLGTGRVGVLFCAGMFPLDHDTISLEQLRHHELIGLAPSVAIGDLVGPIVSAATGGAPAIQVRSVFIAAGLARSCAGVAIVDEFTAQAYVDDTLHFRPIAPARTFDLSVRHLASHPLSRLSRSFIALKREMLDTAATEGERHVGCTNAMVAHQH